MLGQILLASRTLDDAQAALQKATELNPDSAEAWLALGNAVALDGNDGQAFNYFSRALALKKDFVEAHMGLAEVLVRREDNRAALEELDRALALSPNLEPVQQRKAQILTKLERYDDAVALCHALAGRTSRNRFIALNDLGNLYRDLGRLDEALYSYRESAALSKMDPTPLSNQITLMHYMPHADPLEILALCKEWGRRFAPRTVTPRAEATDHCPTRVLRLGLLSDGFRQHPVGSMITSSLECLRGMGMDLHFYPTNNMVDPITQRLMAIATGWTPVAAMSDTALAQRIRSDKIDILLDLAGHNAGTRMKTIAMEPAPLIVKWVGGLINTTGVESIDYLITDSVESPPGSDSFYTEKLIRMPDDYICYTPPPRIPALTPLPALRNGFITFGCFNNPTKLNPIILGQWTRLMKAVPESHLFLKSGAFGSEELRARTLQTLAEQGIPKERIRIEGRSAHYELLECYNEVDIALDPWPYSGGLTTCEAMLMGVPVVSLPGPTFAGRHSATHLANAGMPELIVSDWDEYINRAQELAADLQSLSAIRAHLRQILLNSAVCDAPKFAHHLADALRAIWQRYCEGKAPAALAFTPEALPWFEDEDAPTHVEHPEMPEEQDESFRFSFKGKIVALDHGGVLATSGKLSYLSKLRAFSMVIIDPAGSVSVETAVGENGDIRHYRSHFALGDGQPSVLHACLDASISGTLTPLPADRLLPFMRQCATVLARLPIPTICLDDIEGLERLDWLILDEHHDALQILQGSRRLLKNTLVVQVRVLFQSVFENQPAFSRIIDLLRAQGLRLLRLENAAYHNYLPDGKKLSYGGGQLLYADAIFVPEDARIKSMNENQRARLAFLMHTAYGLQDIAYHVLALTDENSADKYLAARESLPSTPQPVPAKPQRTASPRMDQAHSAPLPTGFSGDIPSMPHMEQAGIAALSQHLASASVFLEFGSGGSSIMAAKSSINRIYSVDSDKDFLAAVEKKVRENGTPDGKYIPIHIDIGPTGAWGYPTDLAYEARWPEYANTPWAMMREAEHQPDLILIDGRFRVACLLATMQSAPAGAIVLFDDYADSPAYHVVEEIVKPIRLHGRMAEFSVPKTRPRNLQKALMKYSVDPK